MINKNIIGITLAELFIILFFSVLIIYPYSFDSSKIEELKRKISLLESIIHNLNNKILQKDKKINYLKNELKKRDEEINKLNKELSSLKKLPKIILYGTDFRFSEGSADISGFVDKLKKEILPEVNSKISELRKYGINSIEIIGHTDGAIPFSNTSNFDYYLDKVILKQIDISQLHYGSNIDLGFMRAAAIYLFLKDNLTVKDNLHFRILSAGQTSKANGQLIDKIERKSDINRRRIEIRFSRLDIDTVNDMMIEENLQND